MLLSVLLVALATSYKSCVCHTTHNVTPCVMSDCLNALCCWSCDLCDKQKCVPSRVIPIWHFCTNPKGILAQALCLCLSGHQKMTWCHLAS
jgi:hypothetical protein